MQCQPDTCKVSKTNMYTLGIWERIETTEKNSRISSTLYTPGIWERIKTPRYTRSFLDGFSLPAFGRGSKHTPFAGCNSAGYILPAFGRGSKPIANRCITTSNYILPAFGRGSKQEHIYYYQPLYCMLPSWGEDRNLRLRLFAITSAICSPCIGERVKTCLTMHHFLLSL